MRYKTSLDSPSEDDGVWDSRTKTKLGGKEMDWTTIKKYPSQISTAFKRFPLAVAFAIFTTIAFICIFECKAFFSITKFKLLYWLSIYPIAATMIALTISLVQESRKKFNAIPQVVAGVSWFAISIALVFCRCSTDSHIDPAYVQATLKFIYTTIFLIPTLTCLKDGPIWLRCKCSVVISRVRSIL